VSWLLADDEDEEGDCIEYELKGEEYEVKDEEEPCE